MTVQECETVKPYGFDSGNSTGRRSDWRPLKLNSVLRISRYDVGGHFAFHQDGAFVEHDNVRSVYTVLIYLNEPPEFDGGNTIVQMPKCSTEDQQPQPIPIVPQTGTALVMLHDVFHAGQVVTQGHKYICRLDIMFHRLHGSMTETELNMIPQRVEAERFYASSIKKQRQGDPHGSTQDYLAAQQLQAQLPSCTVTTTTDCHPHDTSKGADIRRGSSWLSNLNDELILLCFRYLQPKEVCELSLVSKWFYHLGSSSLLWREYFLLRWPTLVHAESMVPQVSSSSRDDPGSSCGTVGSSTSSSIPLEIRGRPTTNMDRYGRRQYPTPTRNQRSYTGVYVTILSSPPQLYQDGRDTMNRMYTHGRRPNDKATTIPSGYMFSSLQLVEFTQKARNQYKNWQFRKITVNEGCIQFHKDGGGDKELPSSIPLHANTDIMFASKDYKETQYDWLHLDCCIVELPPIMTTRKRTSKWKWTKFSSTATATTKETHTKRYLAICMESPLLVGESKKSYCGPYYYTSGFCGILSEIARVVVARQTERVLLYSQPAPPTSTARSGSASQDVIAIQCDAKTKQWKAAYGRRHLAERFFDVVTIDVGSKYTKFTSSSSSNSVSTVLQHTSSWLGTYWLQGPYRYCLKDVTNYFVKIIQRYKPEYLMKNQHITSFLQREEQPTQDVKERMEFLQSLVEDNMVNELLELAAQNGDDDWILPQPLVDAQQGCGSIQSILKNARGHLWSAGRGLQNHIVGEQCLIQPNDPRVYGNGGVGEIRTVYEPTTGQPNMNSMGIVMSYVVQECFVHRPTRSGILHGQSCAEHPIQVVEPVMGFTEVERQQLIQILSSWNVPFVGFVNGAVAALMCGAKPQRNGMVVMLGGIHSAVVVVKDSTVVQQVPLGWCCCCDKDDDLEEDVVVKEVVSAIVEIRKQTETDQLPATVLMTGGRATDRIVASVQSQLKLQHGNLQVVVASRERQRHLDAVRGAHILANLSDGRKYFRGVMNGMWSMQVSGS